MDMGKGLWIPTVSFHEGEKESGFGAVASGTSRGLNSLSNDLKEQGFGLLTCLVLGAAACEVKSGRVKRQRLDFCQSSLGQVGGVPNLFSFRISVTLILWPKYFFFLHMSHTLLYPVFTLRILALKTQQNTCAHRNPLLILLICCGISCHSNGYPHTHLGFPSGLFSFLIFSKQQQPTLLLNKLLIYLSWQFLTGLHLLLTSGPISHAL